MTADELRRLAVLIERTDHDAIDRAAAYLRACADAQEKGPVAWRYRYSGAGCWMLCASDPAEARDPSVETCDALYPVAMPALRLPEPMKDMIDAAPTPPVQQDDEALEVLKLAENCLAMAVNGRRIRCLNSDDRDSPPDPATWDGHLQKWEPALARIRALLEKRGAA